MKKLVLLCVIFCCAVSAVDAGQKITVSSPSAIVMNAATGTQVYGKRVHARRPAASTVKVMTALLAIESGKLDTLVTASKKAAYTQASKIHVAEGVQYKMRDLVAAALVCSANDACVVIAEGISGTEWEFVKCMNARAKELGADNTFFANSHGLPDKKLKQYSTVYDLTLILREALKHQTFIDLITTRTMTIVGSNGTKITLNSHNKGLWLWPDRRIVYGKTGFTRAARHCYVGFYPTKKNNGRLSPENDYRIFAMLGCPRKMWSDVRKLSSF